MNIKLRHTFKDTSNQVLDFPELTLRANDGFLHLTHIGFKTVYRVSDYIDSIQKDIESLYKTKIAVLCPTLTTLFKPYY